MIGPQSRVAISSTMVVAQIKDLARALQRNLANVLLGRWGASRPHRSRQAWTGRLHHQVLPPLVAAQRALDRGDIRAAQDLLRDATDEARSLLHQPATIRHTEEIVRDAATAATRTWGSDLSVEVAIPPTGAGRLGHLQRTVVREAVLEALHNVGRHQPGGHARVSLANHRGLLRITVSARGFTAADHEPRGTVSAVPAGDEGGGGFGLAHLRSGVERIGGRITTTYDDDSSVVVFVIPRHSFARWGLRPLLTGRQQPGWPTEVAS